MDVLLAQAKEAAAQTEPIAQFRELYPDIIRGRTLHLDGDYLAYFAAGTDETPAGVAIRIARERIEQFRLMAGAEKVVVHLTSSGSDKGKRGLVAVTKPYQANRAGSTKPKNWSVLRNYLETEDFVTFKRIIWDDREADDGIALYAHRSFNPVDEVVVCTRDKDMRMLPGTHIDWVTFELTVVPAGCYEVVRGDGKVFGNKFFYLQLLMGDTADNIPGLPLLFGKQCGAARASEYLKGTMTWEEAFERVSEAYKAYYNDDWEDRLVEQASLLYMRHTDDADVASFLPLIPLHDAAIRLRRRIAKQEQTIASICDKAASREAEITAKELMSYHW